MKQTINRKLYNTDTAVVIASDHYWDGSNLDRNGRNTFLYRTKKGRYFAHHTSQWSDEEDCIVALSQSDAADAYETLLAKEVDFEDAFPEIDLLVA